MSGQRLTHRVYAFERGVLVRVAPPRLEMIRNRDPDSLDRRPFRVGDVAQTAGGVSGQPQVQRAQGLEPFEIHGISAASVGPLNGDAAVRAVGVHTIDCVPRTKAINPKRSATFIEIK